MSTNLLAPTRLARLCGALEVPDCGCLCNEDPSLPPCEHVTGAPNHGVSLEDWAALLTACWPAEYTEPPPPTRPALALSHEARVEVMAARHAAGLGLWHDGDLVQVPPPQAVPQARNGRNGAKKKDLSWTAQKPEAA